MERRSIIVCDDELELANEIGEFFDSNGWRVLVCGSASHVRQALSEGFVATCLLTDLRLGDGNGAELIEFARRLPPGRRPKVIAMITGHAADPAAAGNFGADLLYFKPVDPFVVLADVNSRIVAPEPARATTLEA
jgi:DNA-binding response OmpR family regulator